MVRAQRSWASTHGPLLWVAEGGPQTGPFSAFSALWSLSRTVSRRRKEQSRLRELTSYRALADTEVQAASP